ncbi:hypothetical protein A0H76_915 [Hepatospora eriocheir]|uniref:Uncharacterized protein n=1 Tax=Hepatospora eriocheir TaxID=1081669 RepID=A0A1X0QI15_9MICR|nr:hypothetical protein A0H76_915 [Hepatospora eriocheir]
MFSILNNLLNIFKIINSNFNNEEDEIINFLKIKVKTVHLCSPISFDQEEKEFYKQVEEALNVYMKWEGETKDTSIYIECINKRYNIQLEMFEDFKKILRCLSTSEDKKNDLKMIIEKYENVDNNEEFEKNPFKESFKIFYKKLQDKTIDYLRLIIRELFKQQNNDRDVIMYLEALNDLYVKTVFPYSPIKKILTIFRNNKFAKMFYESYDHIMPLVDLIRKNANGEIITSDMLKLTIHAKIRDYEFSAIKKLYNIYGNTLVFDKETHIVDKETHISKIINLFVSKVMYLFEVYNSLNLDDDDITIPNDTQKIYMNNEILDLVMTCKTELNQIKFANDKDCKMITDFVNFIIDFIEFVNTSDCCCVLFNTLSKKIYEDNKKTKKVVSSF